MQKAAADSQNAGRGSPKGTRNLLVRLVLIVAALIPLIAAAALARCGDARGVLTTPHGTQKSCCSVSNSESCFAKVGRSTLETIAGSYRNTHHIVYLIMPQRRLIFNYLADFLTLL